MTDHETHAHARTPFGTAAMAAFSMPGPRPEVAPPQEAPVLAARASLAGIDVVLDPSAALYWPAAATLVVSDLHLETGSSYARGGQMLPPYDTSLTLRKLEEVVARYRPARVVSLGDTFHDPFGVERLSGEARRRIDGLMAAAEFVWVSGNHEKDCAGALGGRVCEAWTHEGVTFRHIPQDGTPEAPEIAGHLHPAARIAVRGRSVRRRCFIGCDRRLVMPAFGAYTGGLCVTDHAFVSLWPTPPGPRLHLLGRGRVYSV